MTTFLDYTIRMSVILSIALLSMRLLRRQSAALRHLVLSGAILCAAVLPIFNRALPSLDWSPRIDLPGLPAPVERVVHESIASVMTHQALPSPTRQTSPLPPATTEVAVSEPQVTMQSQEVAPPPPTQTIRVDTVLRFVYIAGAGLSFVVLLMCLVRLGRIGLRARPVGDVRWTRLANEISQEYGLRRPLDILESCSPAVLATWGLFRPRIVIPLGAGDWTEDRIRVVLGHELAHVRRRDWLVQLSAEVFRAVFWFNPLVWIIGRRLRQESEHACDDAVLNRGVPAPEYAAHLLDLARVLGSPGPAWAPALLMARPSTLEQRFEAMLNPRLKRSKVSRPYLLLTFGAFLCIALPLAALRATPRVLTTESVQTTAIHTANTIRSAVLSVLQVQASTSAIPTPNSIEGLVVRLGTSEPVSDVDVELRRVEGTASSPLGPLVFPPGNFGPGAIVRATYPNPSDISNVRTKADGKFVFTNLKPGTYRLQAARAGGAYYPAEYGQRSPKGKGYDFQFVEGQSMRDVRLQMAPTGSITGRIRDAEGQPAARVRVMALEATYPAGERTLGIIQAVQTDDKGEYRLFWLPPGQYVIAARPEDPRRQTLQLFITPPGSSDGRETYPQAPLTFRTLDDGTVVEETFEVVYYGGDPDVKKARSVDLPPGGTLNGIDLSLARSVRTRRVRGTLFDPSGARVPGVTISALPRNSGPSMVAPTAITDATGTFELAGVGTGAYTLRGALPGFAGFAPLGAGDTNVEGVTINMSLGGLRVQGKIVIEGRASDASPPDLSKISVRLENSIPGLPGASSSAVNGDAFTVSAPQAGDYRVTVNPLLVPYTSDAARRPAIPPDLQNAYVKAIRLNADDGLAGNVNVASQPGQLEVVIALNGGRIEGVVNDRLQPAPNAVVVLVPAVRSRIDLYRIATSSGDGRFRMQGIPPGEYKAFAWEHVEDGVWYDPEFTRANESKGRPVRITEGSNSDLTLTMERP
jgi:beta-lactamase regulating signal transducer with metallopeptidase domain